MTMSAMPPMYMIFSSVADEATAALPAMGMTIRTFCLALNVAVMQPPAMSSKADSTRVEMSREKSDVAGRCRERQHLRRDVVGYVLSAGGRQAAIQRARQHILQEQAGVVRGHDDEAAARPMRHRTGDAMRKRRAVDVDDDRVGPCPPSIGRSRKRLPPIGNGRRVRVGHALAKSKSLCRNFGFALFAGGGRGVGKEDLSRRPIQGPRDG